PWQPSSELFDMLAAPVRVAVAAPFVPPDLAGTSIVSPVWLVNDTPVVEQLACPASAVIDAFVPFSETPVTRTGYGFGLLTRISTSPVEPGYRLAVVDAETSTVVSVVAVPAFT